MPKIYGYCRVSTDEQARSGLGLESQQYICEHYINYLLGCAKYTHLTPGEIFTEKTGVSASKVDLIRRPEGYRLHMILEEGDHVVIAKHDRCFRSVRDFQWTRPVWEARDVTMHFANLSMDMTTPTGNLLANVMVSVAEWESRVISERTKDALEAKKRRGEAPTGDNPGPGYQFIGKRRMLVPNRDDYPILRLITWLHERQGMSFAKISDRIEQLLAERENRKPIRRVVFNGPGRKWSKDRCRRAYINFAKIDQEDVPTPVRPWRPSP